MANKFRVTWFFSGKSTGWSETHVIDSALTSPGELAGQMIDITQKRANMLGSPFQIDGYRVSLVQLADGTPVVRQAFIVEGRIWKAADQTAAHRGDPAFVGAKTFAVNAPGNRRAVFIMGGIPDAVTVEGGSVDFAQAHFQSDFDAWNAALVNALNNFAGPCGWFSHEEVSDNRITGYAVSADLVVSITIAGVGFTGFAPGTLMPVRIRGLNGRSSLLNGAQRVAVVDNTHCTIELPTAVGPFVSAGNMRVYHPLPTFWPATTFGLQGIGRHKRGRPFFAPRGRQPAKKRV